MSQAPAAVHVQKPVRVRFTHHFCARNHTPFPSHPTPEHDLRPLTCVRKPMGRVSSHERTPSGKMYCGRSVNVPVHAFRGWMTQRKQPPHCERCGAQPGCRRVRCTWGCGRFVGPGCRTGCLLAEWLPQGGEGACVHCKPPPLPWPWRGEGAASSSGGAEDRVPAYALAPRRVLRTHPRNFKNPHNQLS